MSLTSNKSVKVADRVRIEEHSNGVYVGTLDIHTTRREEPYSIRFEIIPHDQRIYIRPPHPLSHEEMALVNEEIASVGRMYQFDTSGFEATIHPTGE